ncbi:MAG: right-handed parallel beta-helix repeat-containing protein [Lentisphaeria bacterium]
MIRDRIYYIDPLSGHDANSGLEPETPWKSFAPLNRRRLVAGDHVKVLTPGAFHETLILRGGGMAGCPVTVHFAPGRYDLYPNWQQARLYDISNCNSDRLTPKPAGILFDQAHHIRIRGNGARLICRGKMIEISLNHSSAITCSELTFDYHRPTVSEFSVTKATDNYADLAIHLDSDYRIEDDRIIWEGEGWAYDSCLTQELDSKRKTIRRTQNPLQELKLEALEKRRVRAYGEHTLTKGFVYQQRNPFRDCCGVFINHSRDVLFSRLKFLYMHGMGILCQFSENITLDTVSIAPDTNSGRTCAAWADCFHASGCRGQITVRNCVFDGAHDDAINIHGTYMRIVEQTSERQLKARFMHPQTFGFTAFSLGDEINLVRWDTLMRFGPNRVTGVEMVDPYVQLLTLEKPVPDNWHENDVIENVTWTPEVQITGCITRRIPTRGFLVSTPKKTEIRANTFNKPYMNGVLIACDANNWFESGSVQDVTIASNRFIKCGGDAIRIRPNNPVPNPAVHQNIRIIENNFVLDGKAAVDAKGTTGLTISRNTVTAPEPAAPKTAFQFETCKNVSLTTNNFIDNKNGGSFSND